MARSSFNPRRLWSAETGVFLIIWLLLMVAGRERLLRDPGTFWHTVVGRKILADRAMIRTDPFSFRMNGRTWLSHQWLGEVCMAGLDRVAGLDGLLLGGVALLAATYAWATRRLIRLGTDWPIAACLVALTVAASSYHFLVRPHLASILFMGLVFARLADFEAGRIGWRGLTIVPLLFVLWGNTHGAALGGLVTVWIAALGWLIAGGSVIRQFRRITAPEPGSPGLTALGVAALCVWAVLLNPFGLDLPRTWLGLMAAPSLPQLIIEHAPLSLRSVDGWMVVLLGCVYLAALSRVPFAKLRVTWFVPLVWLVLTLTRIRHGPLFAITALVALADILPIARQRGIKPIAGLPDGPLPPQSPRPPPLTAAAIPVALTAITLMLQTAGFHLPLLGAGWARLDPTYWPTNALPALHEQVARGPAQARVLNDMLFGGFLIYHAPPARVFIDDRCELYGETLLSEYVRAARERPAALEEWAGAHDAGSALVHPGTPFDRYLSKASDWRCLHRDAAAVLYARTTVRTSAGSPGSAESP